ncbi:hypothetical protein [Streptomyces botrytidirepellens]|uniref:Uncharacterized protein n=1 Tax=Streptomyces botrytidirepellens TaxID=2486417 RepID=A0A3M8W9N1_9ACTN|nr:hypothetical protein [Streptomyces botrytidirepellens]RNG26250.1 hypothetical protein EEJ42_15745 [Streptomyces botrytidirepellens]
MTSRIPRTLLPSARLDGDKTSGPVDELTEAAAADNDAALLPPGAGVGAYLDTITGHVSVDGVLEQARRDGVDLEELEQAAADRLGAAARRLNGPGGQSQADRERAAALNLLIDKIGALQPHNENEDQLVHYITLLVEAARDGDEELIDAIGAILAKTRDVPRALGALLANIHRTCPDDTRRPDGRPDMLALSGTHERKPFVQRAGNSERDAQELWETRRAASQLLDAALTGLKDRGHQDGTLAVLRKGLAAAPELATPAVRIAAEDPQAAAASWLGEVRTEDAMVPYSDWFGDWSDFWGNYAWQPLRGGDHRAVSDCRAVVERLREMAKGRGSA